MTFGCFIVLCRAAFSQQPSHETPLIVEPQNLTREPLDLGLRVSKLALQLVILYTIRLV